MKTQAKPGDHPEFFRLPPPAGQSRESSIVLDAQGRFWHEGNPVEHPGLARAFASWVTRHPDDGRYILSNGYDWSYFSVQGTPFFVLKVRTVEGVPVLRLSSGEEESLDPSTLRIGAEGAVVAAVRGGAFRAKFSQAAQLDLAPYLVELPGGTVGVRVGERVVALHAEELAEFSIK